MSVGFIYLKHCILDLLLDYYKFSRDCSLQHKPPAHFLTALLQFNTCAYATAHTKMYHRVEQDFVH